MRIVQQPGAPPALHLVVAERCDGVAGPFMSYSTRPGLAVDGPTVALPHSFAVRGPGGTRNVFPSRCTDRLWCRCSVGAGSYLLSARHGGSC